MNLTTTLNKITPFQQLCMAMFLLVTGFGTGVTYTEHSHGVDLVQTEELKEFDIFKYQAQNEVIPLMESAFENPSEENLRHINNKLKLMEWGWLSRNEGANKEAFTDYLNACQLVIDHKQEGTLKQSDIDKINSLYSKLK